MFRTNDAFGLLMFIALLLISHSFSLQVRTTILGQSTCEVVSTGSVNKSHKIFFFYVSLKLYSAGSSFGVFGRRTRVSPPRYGADVVDV